MSGLLNSETLVTLPTRALSLSWPWSYFMLDLPEAIRKKIENRQPGFSYKSFRGECWVHATKPKSKAAFYDACEFAVRHGVPRELLPPMVSAQVGCIVGRWEVVDLLPMPDLCQLPDRWRMVGQVGFVIENARRVEPVKCNGALGFWSVPTEKLLQLGGAK